MRCRNIVVAGHRLIEPGPGGLLGFHQIDLVLSDLLNPEFPRRPTEVLGELGHRPDIGLDRARRVVAHTKILDHSLTQRAHAVTPFVVWVGKEEITRTHEGVAL
jgi:hypothetical protein